MSDSPPAPDGVAIGRELPAEARPDLDASALLVVDVQNDFLDDGAFPVPGTRAVLPPIAELLGAFRRAQRPIVHVIRIYEGEDVDLLRRALVAGGAKVVRPGSDGALVPPEVLDAEQRQHHPALHAGALVQVAPREWMMFKPRWSAFFRTRLDGHLRALGVDTVVVAGCNFPNCPRATLYDATSYDYRAVAVVDAISGVIDAHVAELPRAGVAGATVAEVVRGLDGELAD